MMQKEDNMAEKEEIASIPYKVVEPAPCSRTALVRDRYIDDIKSGMKTERFKKVDDDVWDKVVQRMKEKERKRMENKKSRTDKEPAHRDLIEALEKRVETLEKKHQDLIDNLRIFMVNEEEKEHGK